MEGAAQMTPPQPPANVAIYVDLLGLDAAIDFLLAFGGAELYHPDDPKGGSKVAKVIGLHKARKLAAASPVLKSRVPIPREWLAKALYAKGLPVAEIARTLHVTDVTVRKYIDKGAAGKRPRRADNRQPSLF